MLAWRFTVGLWPTGPYKVALRSSDIGAPDSGTGGCRSTRRTLFGLRPDDLAGARIYGNALHIDLIGNLRMIQKRLLLPVEYHA